MCSCLHSVHRFFVAIVTFVTFDGYISLAASTAGDPIVFYSFWGSVLVYEHCWFFEVFRANVFCVVVLINFYSDVEGCYFLFSVVVVEVDSEYVSVV